RALAGEPSAAPAAAAASRAEASGLAVTRRTVSRESERSAFSARGVVATADGREIAVAVELAMAREHVEVSQTRVAVGSGPRQDPLVLNLDGGPVRLSAARHAIDLNGDGAAEAVPLLAGGSAYLAWDRNGNGRVDDGGELFGPVSGDGLGELAARDSDGNGWIDEADPAFARLSLWAPAAAGGGRLTGLAEAGIGAIGLASAATPFELRGARNEDLGAVRRTGVYLTEAGHAGTMQEIDLTA
ncbi:MAG TPA: hypothetical protein PKD29_09190, partial [Rhodocyclaceae bacterium]|nr:hypothetical protein [Rhodocyclaceae bacterium]